MNLAKEISILSDAFWSGLLTAEQYYALCDILIRLHNLEREWKAYG